MRNNIAEFLDEKNSEEKRILKKGKFSARIDFGLLDRVRNAVYYVPGLTLTSLVERGLEKVLEEIEDRRDTPIPERPNARLMPGRRLKG